MFKQNVIDQIILNLFINLYNLNQNPMKTTFKVMLICLVLVGSAIVYSTSCKKAVEAAAYTCQTTGTGCSAFKVCVDKTGSTGYYEYNGIKYNFTSATLSQAATNCANAIVAACYKKSEGISDEGQRLFFEQLKADMADETRILVESVTMQEK